MRSLRRGTEKPAGSRPPDVRSLRCADANYWEAESPPTSKSRKVSGRPMQLTSASPSPTSTTRTVRRPSGIVSPAGLDELALGAVAAVKERPLLGSSIVSPESLPALVVYRQPELEALLARRDEYNPLPVNVSHGWPRVQAPLRGPHRLRKWRATLRPRGRLRGCCRRFPSHGAASRPRPPRSGCRQR
jgi:hypothetical protein